MDLFSTPATLLVADPEGGIHYHPDFATPDQARAWFDILSRDADWSQQRRPMYDRVVDVPRLQAAYAVETLPPALPLADMLARVRAQVEAPFNAIGLNLYRHGSDSVAMHNDKLHTLVPGQPIALVSLGASRRMNIRAKHGQERALGVDLEPGSLLVMSHASQHTHEHGIPKTTRAVGVRMSVVFRVRPQRWVGQ